jgi:uncharacterized membrane protein YciS (DUF1049 family)
VILARNTAVSTKNNNIIVFNENSLLLAEEWLKLSKIMIVTFSPGPGLSCVIVSDLVRKHQSCDFFPSVDFGIG